MRRGQFEVLGSKLEGDAGCLVPTWVRSYRMTVLPGGTLTPDESTAGYALAWEGLFLSASSVKMKVQEDRCGFKEAWTLRAVSAK